MPSCEQDRFERSTETLCSPPQQPATAERREACLVHIYPTGPGMGRRYPMGDAPILIGRGTDCGIQIDDHAVSRRHARIEPSGRTHQAVDLESTNGTFVNGVPAARQELEDGDYLRVGNRIYRYLAGGNVEAEYHEEIYRLTIIDALTDIHNKRYLLEFLDRELARTHRYARALALIMFDIDRFKTVNEKFGHLGGDFTLRALSSIVKACVRKEELFARYGGEEFTIVLPETAHEGAQQVAERIRGLVENHSYDYEGTRYQVTISIGVAVTLGDEPLTPHELIRRADEKLFRAKQDGRNRVVV
jgi:diguanylate cyclase (GGDEF)-like protein